MPTRKGSDNRFPLVRLVEDAIDSDPTPAGELHLRADEATSTLYTVDDAGNVETWPSLSSTILKAIVDAKGDLIAATAADTVARLPVGDDGDVLTANSALTFGMEWAPPSGGPGGGVPDPVEELFGAPATAFEFASSSLSGLTAFGTPDTEDADTTVPGHYYLEDNASSSAWVGRYVASPSMPFTAVAKIADINLLANFNHAGLIVGAASMAGAFVTLGANFNSGRFNGFDKWTNLTTYGSAVNSTVLVTVPFYVAIVANSSTDLDAVYSFNGWVWRTLSTAYNPSLTVGAVAIGMSSQHGDGMGVAFDYLRIFNGALTFPGAIL